MIPVEVWIGLAFGLAPYLVKHTRATDKTAITEIKALGWSLYVARQPDGAYDWAIRIRLLDLLRTASVALLRLRQR